jgi:hypothetical protein
MHTPDMPLLGNDSPKLGLGLWRHRELSLAAELAAFGAGVWFWLRAPGRAARAPQGRIATTVFLVLLTAILLSTPFMPPPAGPRAFAATALVGYALLAGAAAFVDRRRNALSRA